MTSYVVGYSIDLMFGYRIDLSCGYSIDLYRLSSPASVSEWC